MATDRQRVSISPTANLARFVKRAERHAVSEVWFITGISAEIILLPAKFISKLIVKQIGEPMLSRVDVLSIEHLGMGSVELIKRIHYRPGRRLRFGRNCENAKNDCGKVYLVGLHKIEVF